KRGHPTLTTRNPAWRSPASPHGPRVLIAFRYAARTCHAGSAQDPPRRTWTVHVPSSQYGDVSIRGEPSVGTPSWPRWEPSDTHSCTWPGLSWRPNSFGGQDPTAAVNPTP